MAPFFRGWLARVARAVARFLPPPFIRYVPPPTEWESLLARFPDLREQLESFREMPPPTWETKRLRYTSFLWTEDPALIVPRPDQKITARYLLIDQEGNVYSFEVSMPPGMAYDRDYLMRSLTASINEKREDELGRYLEPEERLSTPEAEDMIVTEEYFITEVEPRL